MEPYRDSIEHIADELKRIDLLLRRELVAARQPHAPTIPDEFRGLVISDHEIDSILAAGDFLGDRWRAREAAKDLLDPIDEKLQQLRHDIDEREAPHLKKWDARFPCPTWLRDSASRRPKSTFF